MNSSSPIEITVEEIFSEVTWSSIGGSMIYWKAYIIWRLTLVYISVGFILAGVLYQYITLSETQFYHL